MSEINHDGLPRADAHRTAHANETLPWLSEPMFLLAGCKLHELTVCHWLVAPCGGKPSWLAGLEASIGIDRLSVEIQVTAMESQLFEVRVLADECRLLDRRAPTLHAGMLLGELLAASALRDALVTRLDDEPPA